LLLVDLHSQIIIGYLVLNQWYDKCKRSSLITFIFDIFLTHMLPSWDSIIFLDMNTPIQHLDKILRQTLKNNRGKISLSIPVPLSVILTIDPVFQLFFSFLH